MTTSVVFSAVAGFFIAGGEFKSFDFVALIFGGFLVVAASNGFNQLLEKDFDKLMKRTENRPLPKQRITINQALFFSLSMGLIGIFCLFSINFYSGLFGLLSLILYVLAYTPLKRISSLSVFVGAFPGAIPFMLGWIAVSNNFAIDDYNKAGFKMLPSGKSKSTAFKTLIYTLFLIPLSILPTFSFTGQLELSLTACLLSIILGLWFFTKSVILFKSLSNEHAKQLMYASFVYLPSLQLIYIIDKIL